MSDKKNNWLFKSGKTIRLRWGLCRSRISAGFGKSAGFRPEPEPKSGTALVVGSWIAMTVAVAGKTVNCLFFIVVQFSHYCSCPLSSVQSRDNLIFLIVPVLLVIIFYSCHVVWFFISSFLSAQSWPSSNGSCWNLACRPEVFWIVVIECVTQSSASWAYEMCWTLACIYSIWQLFTQTFTHPQKIFLLMTISLKCLRGMLLNFNFYWGHFYILGTNVPY